MLTGDYIFKNIRKLLVENQKNNLIKANTFMKNEINMFCSVYKKSPDKHVISKGDGAGSIELTKTNFPDTGNNLNKFSCRP